VTAAAVCAPARLPAEFAKLDHPVEGGLPVGAPGKVGVLELSLARHGGTTRIERHYQQAPLHVYRPIHLDENLPEMAFVFVQQFGDGYVDGDRCRIDIDCGPDTTVHVTTQAATNVYRAERNFASQLVNLHVGSGAVLEYMPDAVVPFRGSRFFQRTCLTADSNATAIVGEMLLPGRVARGELHAYELYRAETEARRPDGTLLFADLLRLSPTEGEGVRSLGLLGGSDVVATLYAVSERQPADELVELVRASLADSDVLAGVSELPNGCGVSVRLLGRTSTTVRAALTTSWQAVRLALLDAPTPNLRKG
jgi:urease accessory protein